MTPARSATLPRLPRPSTRPRPSRRATPTPELLLAEDAAAAG